MLLPFPLAAWLGVRVVPRLEARASALAQLGDGRTCAAQRAERARSTRGPSSRAACLWICVSYFPVSNIPVLLPTVRAERFWYFPAIGSSLLLALAFAAVARAAQAPGRSRVTAVVGVILLFFGVQGGLRAPPRERLHRRPHLLGRDAQGGAAQREGAPQLLGHEGRARRPRRRACAANAIALELAPQWPMASVYLGDTLCRLHRAPEAWPHYVRGFELAPNDVNLVALALQCLWDEKMLAPRRSDIRDRARRA